MELLLGCGLDREKKLALPGKKAWDELVTLDMNAAHKPDIVHDLELFPYPFGDNTFGEIHAYDVMEHTGRQGDWRFFFAQWSELWRIMKPEGMFFGVSPHMSSPWAWGDPGHTRIMTFESFVFLNQADYTKNVGNDPMTDYRFCYRADWECSLAQIDANKQFHYALKAIKPSRIKH